MAKNTERLVLLEGMILDRKHYLYYVASFEDGVYLCRSAMTRRGKKIVITD